MTQPLFKGAVYDLQKFGPAEYLGLDDKYTGKLSHWFRAGEWLVSIEPEKLDAAMAPPQIPNNEEMENYRMALAYISKQSTDQQSRELAETALNCADTRPDRASQAGGSK